MAVIQVAALAIQKGAQIRVGVIASQVGKEAIERELSMSQQCDRHLARRVGIERRDLSEVGVVDEQQAHNE